MIPFRKSTRQRSVRNSLSNVRRFNAHGSVIEPLESRCMLAQVSGTIASDTAWTTADSPYVVTGNITISSQATLTIEPGVTVQFRPNVGMTVNGRLLAEGTPAERITFERALTSKWSGINFKNSLADNRITYADMTSGDSGGQLLDVDHSRLLVDNVTWSGTAGTVIEVLHPSLIVRNSAFPISTNGNEVLHGEQITGDEYLIVEGNVFANSNNGADVIDFLGANRPGPVMEVRNNIFLGGGDDGLDLDGTDAYIEGNVFMNFKKNTSRATTSNAIATGLPQDGESIRTEITVVRNIFIDNDHAILLKEDAFATVENNVFIGSRIATMQFNEVGGTAVKGVGKGADLTGNIFVDNKLLFKNLIDQPSFKTHLTVNNNLLPNEVVDFGGTPINAHDLGTANISGDPLFVDQAAGDFRLQPGSPAIGAGRLGIDLGPIVPSGAMLVPRGPIGATGDVTVDVGGPGVSNYRYRLDGGTLSELRPVSDPIELHGLDSSVAHNLQVVAMNDSGEWFTGQTASWQARTVQVITPNRTRSGEALPIVARGLNWQGDIDTTWSPILSLTGAALSETDVTLLKGTAALAPIVSETSDFQVSLEGTQVGIQVLPNDYPTQDVSGTLASDTVWSADVEYHVVDNLTLAAGATLTIEPGTRVMLGDKVNLVANGKLVVNGSAADPVLFNSLDPAKPWGGIELRGNQPYSV
ncbi:MAG: hypothetical protein KDA92_03260, partial [Planctomycetales bacterium]|nr:hypothetical protein [Planctomycetales bacterium]